MILTAVLRLRIDDVAEVAVVGDTSSDLLAGTRSGASMVVGVLSGAHPGPSWPEPPTPTSSIRWPNCPSYCSIGTSRGLRAPGRAVTATRPRPTRHRPSR